jgi:hypothetical protein
MWLLYLRLRQHFLIGIFNGNSRVPFAQLEQFFELVFDGLPNSAAMIANLHVKCEEETCQSVIECERVSNA